MTTSSSKQKQADPELVEQIIHTLKSKGYFDQFRKEFIADADTKPAYHNLQQRVESYVTRFLSQQKWSPTLNKNQLRETLRRQINQTGMLNKGVERIVEQIVNPKIMQLIKPKVDEFTCDHLGISLTEHKNALKRRQQEQQERFMKSPDSGNIQSLFSLNFNSPPPGSAAPPFGSTSSPALPPGQYNQGLIGTGILCPNPTPSQYPPQISFGNPNPAGLSYPGISQQSFPFLPPGWNASMAAGFPPLYPPTGQLVNPYQNFTIPPPGTGITVPPPMAPGGLLMPPVNSALLTGSTPTLTKPSPGKGLNALLGLPTPSEEPPPPGTVVLPDGSHVYRKKMNQDDGMSNQASQDGNTVTSSGIKSGSKEDIDVVLHDIPMPDAEVDAAEKAVNEQIQRAMSEELAKHTSTEYDTNAESGEITSDQAVDGKRQYKFAWDEDIDEMEIDDSVASSEVSSVHTSDLSHFEESGDSSDSDLENLENKLLQLQAQKMVEQVEKNSGQTITEEMPAESQPETVEVQDNDQSEAVADVAVTPVPVPVEPSPVKHNFSVAGYQGKFRKESVPASKPRKLLSLQYNYSDSDEEESREERKARVAREKEERYQRRLQRRAEIEAKRKEREEEKARLRRAKLSSAKEAQGKDVLEKNEQAINVEWIEPVKEIEKQAETEKHEEVEEKENQQSLEMSNELDETVENIVKNIVQHVVEKIEKVEAAKSEDKNSTLEKDMSVNLENAQESQENKMLDGEVEHVASLKEADEQSGLEMDENLQNVPGKDGKMDDDDKDEARMQNNQEVKTEKVCSEKEIVTMEDNMEEVKEAVQQITISEEQHADKDSVVTVANIDNEALKADKEGEQPCNEIHPGADDSIIAESSITAMDSTGVLDTSLAESSSPDKKGFKHRRKTKAELKAELKEQKLMERKSLRQRHKNRRYLSDEFVYKGVPSTHVSTDSYDETMVIEETVEMVEIDPEQQSIDFNDEQLELVEIPLPDGEGQHVTMDTYEYAEVDIPETDGEMLTLSEGATYLVTSSTSPHDGQQIQENDEEVIIEVSLPSNAELISSDSAVNESGRMTTRSRSKISDDIKSNSSDQSDTHPDMLTVQADAKLDSSTLQQDNKCKRKRNASQSSVGESVSKKQMTSPNQSEGRQLRRSDRQGKEGKSSKKSYETDDLYKPRHSFARKSAVSPPPLPKEPPPPSSDPIPPPLPPLPPPHDELQDREQISQEPAQAPESPDDSESSSEDESKSKKRAKEFRSKPRSPKHHQRSKSKDTQSSKSSGKRTNSYSSHSSSSRKPSSRSRSRSRSLSSISSDSNSRASRSRSYSRSYTRSKSRSSSGSRSVSRSRSRSISSISSKKSSYSEDSDERRRKARPLEEVDFGEAAKRARHAAVMMPFGPRMPMGPMGPRLPLGAPILPRGPMGPGPFPPMRGMPPMVRVPRAMIRGRFPSPRHPLAPDGSPIRPPGMSPGKPFYPPGLPRFMPPVPGWEDPIGRPRGYGEEEYYPPEDIHEGPGKTGITKRGTLYREDTSPSPPPERRLVYTPPIHYRESSLSPPIPTGITERGTLYREDTTPSPPPVHRRRIGASVSPPPLRRHRLESLSPSPPPISHKRTKSARSESYELISSSPPHGALQVKASSPLPRRRSVTPPVQRNTPPVLLRSSRAQPTSTPSPPSSGELTPSPPDLRNRDPSPPSPVSPVPLGSISPLSPRGSASPVVSRELDKGSSASHRVHRGRPREPVSQSSSPEAVAPPRSRKSLRDQASIHIEQDTYSHGARGQPSSPTDVARVRETRSRSSREGSPVGMRLRRESLTKPGKRAAR